MTELHDVSVIVIEDCELTAIGIGLRTLNSHKHRTEIRMRCIDDSSRDSLLHSAQNQIGLD